jgi:hypothetical protein
VTVGSSPDSDERDRDLSALEVAEQELADLEEELGTDADASPSEES